MQGHCSTSILPHLRPSSSMRSRDYVFAAAGNEHDLFRSN